MRSEFEATGTIPAPVGLCADCLPEATELVPGKVFAVHCSHNNAGAIFLTSTWRWKIETPVTRDDFFAMLDAASKRGYETRNRGMN